VYKQLSERIYFEMQPYENKANIPDWMEPISKRFLIRLLLAQNYEVSIITTDGSTRPPVAGELETSPESSPVTSPISGRKWNCSEEISDAATSSARKKKKKERRAAEIIWLMMNTFLIVGVLSRGMLSKKDNHFDRITM
jgi:hypothetical protein